MIEIKVDKKIIFCQEGDNLLKVLRDNNIFINAPCGGMGTCNNCKVNIVGLGSVKCCEYIMSKNIELKILETDAKIIETGFLRDVPVTNFDTLCAIDIGTTTIVVYLIREGKIIDLVSSLNKQKRYGDDVISRITYTIKNENGTKELSDLVRKEILEMILQIEKRNNVMVKSSAIVANTTMLHLFAGVSPESIGFFPFEPVFKNLKQIDNFYLLPSISGFAGSDIVSSIVASNMHNSKNFSLLIDIGTNGEIALGNKDKIYTCTAAAGPAFEGGNLNCGIGGISGAINSIFYENNQLKFTTIKNMPPIGICGSAVIELIAAMLDKGLIDTSGYFKDEEFFLTDDIYIDQKDIRQIQLAKSAIMAGILTVLDESKLNINDIETCYIAGGFGSYMDIKSACKIGLIPSELENKTVVLGNAAGMGSVLWQISDDIKKEFENISSNSKYIELSNNSIFNNHFLKCMNFN